MKNLKRKAGCLITNNMIMDLYRAEVREEVAVKALEQLFREMRSLRNLWVITKGGEIMRYKK